MVIYCFCSLNWLRRRHSSDRSPRSPIPEEVFLWKADRLSDHDRVHLQGMIMNVEQPRDSAIPAGPDTPKCRSPGVMHGARN